MIAIPNKYLHFAPSPLLVQLAVPAKSVQWRLNNWVQYPNDPSWISLRWGCLMVGVEWVLTSCTAPSFSSSAPSPLAPSFCLPPSLLEFCTSQGQGWGWGGGSDFFNCASAIFALALAFINSSWLRLSCATFCLLAFASLRCWSSSAFCALVHYFCNKSNSKGIWAGCLSAFEAWVHWGRDDGCAGVLPSINARMLSYGDGGLCK